MTASPYPALDQVLARIAAAAESVGRAPADITLVAVSKTKPIELMKEYALAARERSVPVVFGENYLQELKAKAGLIEGGCELHMIGPLQSNKVRDAVRLSDVIESVHSSKVLDLVRTEVVKLGKKQRIFLQVNISTDTSKSGFLPAELEAATARALEHPDAIELEGFMAITAFYDEPELARPDFQAMHQLRERLTGTFGRPFQLSMGMSADFEVAITEGADVVRVGSALFGERGL
jgi:pyridoxal phosphate enzyme (YggS family)